MSYLDELRESLRLEGGDVITEDWYDDLITYLEKIEKGSAVDYEGVIHKNLIPDANDKYVIGSPDKKIKEIHVSDVKAENVSANVGNFSNNVYVQGKKVIKDEDPIKISEFFDYAKSQIEQAVRDALLNLGIPPKPHLLGYKVDYYAPAMADIFLHNLNVQFDGRVRVKVVGNKDFYTYMKFKPNVAPIEIIAWLNEGKPIKANTWKEMDFTVNKDDEVNVKVAPTTRITILIYNIPEA